MFQAVTSLTETVLARLVHAAWQAGLLALIVLALTWILRSRLQARWRFALWLIVFARLALPVLPAAPWSVFQFVSVGSSPRNSAAADPSATLPFVTSDETSDVTDRTLADSFPRISAAQLPPAFEGAVLPTRGAQWPADSRVSLVHLAALAWITGVVVLSLRRCTSTWQLRRRRRLLREVADPETLSLLLTCRRELRLRRTLALFTTTENLGPAACGIVRPGIVLPQRLLGALSPAELRMVLLHELVHVRRHDVLVDQLASLVTIVHWFHPVAWAARYFLRRERELACDAAVLDLAPPQVAADYGHTLLKTVESLARPAPLPGLVGMFGGGPFSLLARRIRLIAAHRQTTWLSVVSGGLLFATLALVGLTDAQVKQQPPNPEQRSATPAQQARPTTEAPAAKGAEENEDSTYSVPITVSGRALDPAGQPISGAEIFLASPRTRGEPLATAKTDAEGGYRFEKVLLPIKRANTNAGKDAALFEVFGRADGFGLAWRPFKWFYPNSAHVDGTGKENPTLEQADRYDLPYQYGREDPIELDVRFGPPATLRGRVVNDLGEPLAGARLAIRRGEPWAGEPMGNNLSLRNLESFNWPSLVPREIKFRQTDDKGQFEFADLPSDHRFWIDVRPTGHPPRSIWGATRAGVVANRDGERIYSGDFDVVFPRPRIVKIQVLRGDTYQPAAKVGVGGVGVAGFWETTDAGGFVEVPLPDGRYELSLLPRFGTPYLRTEFEIVVSAVSVKEPSTVRLRPAAVVDISVIDADTRQPLTGADVWLNEDLAATPSRRRAHGYRSWEVETGISHYEAPRSDKNGKMRVLFEPGVRRIGVGLEAYPQGYQPVEPDGKTIDCQPGVPTAVQFELRKKVAAEAPKAKAEPAKAVNDRPAKPAGGVFPTNIGGRALDEQGLPVKGATIYLVLTNGSPKKSLGQVTTDENGRYEFRDAPLVSNGQTGDFLEVAYFQVFGKAPGQAYAWRGVKELLIDQRWIFNGGKTPPHRDHEHTSFKLSDKIELDLTFLPAKPITGRCVDEAGEPIAGVSVGINDLRHLDPAKEHEGLGPWAPQQLVELLPEMLRATSDADGRFELVTMPPGIVFNIHGWHAQYANFSLHASTARQPLAEHNGHPIVKLPLDLTLRSERTITIKVTRGEMGEPFAGVSVDARQEEGLNSSAFGKSDDSGRGTLKLPSGKYRLRGSPPQGTDYIRTEQELIIAETPTEQSAALKMEPGCVLVLKASDADRGAPVPGVSFWHELSDDPATRRGRTGVQLDTTHVSHPKTNEQGEIRAVVVPGTRHYGVGWAALPNGYEPADQNDSRHGRELILVGGQTQKVEFKLRKKAAADARKAEAEPAKRTMQVKVIGPDDRPLPRAKVHVALWTEEPFKANRDFVCDAEGKAIIDLPQQIEILRLWASLDKHVALFAQWWPKMQADGHLIPAEYTFQLEQGTLLGGLVKNDAGEPIQGAKVEVSLVGPLGAEQLTLRPFPNTWLSLGDDSIRTDGEGRWQIDNVPAGDDVKVRLLLSHPQYVSETSWGTLQQEQNVSMKSLRDFTGAIVMHRGIELAGSAQDPSGNPIEKAMVIWGDDPYLTHGSQEVQTDAKGAYRLPPRPAGELRVTAVAPGFAPAQQTINLANDTAALDFQLKRGKTLRLRFVDDAGAAIPDVNVGIVAWQGNKGLFNHDHPNVLDTQIPRRAGPDGIYEWTWAPADAVEYSFSKKGYQAVQRRSLPADENEHIIKLLK